MEKQEIIDTNEYYYLLAGLIEAVPFVSNIAGTYGAYLKHWDKRANNKLSLIQLDTFKNNKDNLVFNENALNLIDKIQGDILYIDPPYNKRQYAPNYHILETIARYDNPIIKGKTGIRPYEDLKSNFCNPKKVLNEFENLIQKAKFSHIIVSYSTEGIMNIENIETILKRYGKKESFSLTKIPYRRYKRTTDKVNYNLCELLFYIEK